MKRKDFWNVFSLFVFMLLGFNLMIPILTKQEPLSAANVRAGYTEYNGQNCKMYTRYEATWAAAIDKTSAYAAPVFTDYAVYGTPSTNILFRTFLVYDTSGIPDDAMITGASLYFSTLGTAYTANHIYIQDSNSDNSIEQDDFHNAHFGDLYCDYNWAGGTNAINMSFTNNVATSIDKTGYTTLVVRFYNDYSGAAPVGDNGFSGNDENLIKLWVDYTVADNSPPVNSNPSPANAAAGQYVNPILSITVTEPNGDDMNASFRTNASGSWSTIGTNSSVVNGTYRQTPTTMTLYDHKYWWSVNTSDGMGGWDNDTYYLTTRVHTVTNSNPYPANAATNVETNPKLAITITTSLGHLMNTTFRTNATGSWGNIGTNTSVTNGTYRWINASMDSIATKYWWSVNTTCTGINIWDNDSYYYFTTSDIATYVDDISPYAGTTSPITITATGASALSNVTLYYRWSDTNHSDWYPGVDYADLVLADKFTSADDAQMNYPERIWYDNTNNLLYVACALSDTIFIFDVKKQWDITKLQEVTDNTYLDYFTDTWLINNWTYNGINYGNILFTTGGDATLYFSSFRVNLSTTPTRLNSIVTEASSAYNQLGFMYVFKRGNCLYSVVTRRVDGGKFNIYNVTDPTAIVNMSYVDARTIDAGLTNYWIPTIDKTGQYLWINSPGASTNGTTTTFDISDLTNPVYVAYQLPEKPGTYAYLFRYLNQQNKDIMYSINDSFIAPYNNRPLDVIDVSDPTAWSIIGSSGDTDSTAEFNIDWWGDYAASRHWISGGSGADISGISLWNIANPANIYESGRFYDTSYTDASHMQWLDSNNSRIFVLSYTDNCVYIVNWTVNLAQASSWIKFGLDISSPWSWSFNFPNGTGYYEFCSVGNYTGMTPESFPITADTRCEADLKMMVQLESGWSSFNNQSSFNQIGSGYSIFSNCSASNQLISGWLVFNNFSSSNQLISGWSSFNNASSIIQLESGWFVFNNLSLNVQLGSGWLTLSNSSFTIQIGSGWTTFSNSSYFNPITSGWFIFNGISSITQLGSGWMTFDNASSIIQIGSGWLNFENSSSFNKLASGWLTFSGASTIIQLGSGWMTFNNSSSFNPITSGWLTFNGLSLTIQIQSGWMGFNNASSFHKIIAGWCDFTGTTAPIISLPYPTNNSIVSLPLMQIGVTITDTNSFNYTIELSNGLNVAGINVTTGMKLLNIVGGLNYGTTYIWWVNASDGTGNSSAKYYFTTASAGGGIGGNITVIFDINQMSIVILLVLMGFFAILGYAINNPKSQAAFLIFAGIFSILAMISVDAYFGGIWYLSTPGFIVVAVIFFKDTLLMIIYGDNWRKGNKK